VVARQRAGFYKLTIFEMKSPASKPKGQKPYRSLRSLMVLTSTKMTTKLALFFRNLSVTNRRLLPVVPTTIQRGLKTESASSSTAKKTVPKEKTTTKKIKSAEKPKFEKPRYKDSSK
jgi:hypothetical protein